MLIITIRSFCLIIFSFLATALFAQDDSPVAHMNAIQKAQEKMDQTYMAYMSAAAHTSRPKKIEKMREQTLQSIREAKYKIIGVNIYKNDNSLRSAAMTYVDLLYKIYDDDY